MGDVTDNPLVSGAVGMIPGGSTALQALKIGKKLFKGFGKKKKKKKKKKKRGGGGDEGGGEAPQQVAVQQPVATPQPAPEHRSVAEIMAQPLPQTIPAPGTPGSASEYQEELLRRQEAVARRAHYMAEQLEAQILARAFQPALQSDPTGSLTPYIREISDSVEAYDLLDGELDDLDDEEDEEYDCEFIPLH